MTARPFALALPMLLALLPGCLSSPYDVKATGTDARIIDGYSYDGARVRRGLGDITIELNSARDTGRVLAHVVDGNRIYDVVFNRFRGTETYKDGGIHRDFVEHGATGNGSGELPAFPAYAAAWGSGTIKLNNQTVRDPLTLAESWTAHLMLVRGHVRDPATGAVYKADGRTYFDPQTPHDGFVNRTGAQAILQLKTANNDLYYNFEFEDVRVTKF